MKKNRIIFRADGNVVAGYGHIIRSLSLAAMLKKKYHLVFIVQKTDDFLKKQIQNGCDELIEIPISNNGKTESKEIAKNILKTNDIVVLDGYAFDLNYQQEIKKHCFKLVCIDDIHDRKFIADVIINHSEGIKPKDYSIEKFSKLYLGTPYAILRKSFLKKATNKRPALFTTHKAFINMGGTDQKNFTEKALNICINNRTIKSIDIVIGSYYPYKKELNQIIESNKHVSIKVHSNLSEVKICSLMKRSSLAICSASTISYEYASVGGFLFVYQTVINQKNIYKFLIESKVAYPLHLFDKTLLSLKNKKVASEYFINRSNYFSGNSKQNLISVFQTLEKERGLTIRLAKTDDTLTYFKWANNKDVRKNSINTAPILLDNHKKWFACKLKSKDSKLYIIEKNGVPLGQVRLDREKNNAEIDYSISQKFRGKGFGEIILKNALKLYALNFPNDKIIAKAKQSNFASNRVFEKLDFKKMQSSIINGEEYNVYSTKLH